MKDADKVIEETFEGFKKTWGVIPLVAKEMAKRPEVFIPDMIAATTIYEKAKALDFKTVMLVAFGVATALRSPYCMDVAATVALKAGATAEENLKK
ncbi:MAG: carboxymuconolactone decarboxylase family protein [Candidatus Syntropharchaeia archaeon]